MTGTSRGFAGVVALALVAGAVSAQFGPPAAAGDLTALPMMPGCAFERGWVAAEETNESVMLVAARQALERCMAEDDPPALNRSADNFPARCAEQRAALAAEAITPGILQALSPAAAMGCADGEGAVATAR